MKYMPFSLVFTMKWSTSCSFVLGFSLRTDSTYDFPSAREVKVNANVVSRAKRSEVAAQRTITLADDVRAGRQLLQQEHPLGLPS